MTPMIFRFAIDPEALMCGIENARSVPRAVMGIATTGTSTRQAENFHPDGVEACRCVGVTMTDP